VTDGELLTRFVDRRDEDAFAELVRRHGPVVYRVCCRLVGVDAAEDAFQAVFLVLATRWTAARTAGSVGGWLVGVAGRVARQMRRSARRRTRHETAAVESRTTECADPPGGLTDQFRVLDEELTRLPDSLRDPVVLCFLRGQTQEQAAAELGRDARTLRRRLERAKQVLRARLERRGVVPAVAAALVAGVGSVSAAVPHDLARRTVATVFDFLTGGTAVAGSAPVVLAKGVAGTMIARKLMHLTAAVIVGLVGLGVGLAGDSPPVPQPAPSTTAAVPVRPAEAPVSPARPTAGESRPCNDWKPTDAVVETPAVPRDPAAAERSVIVETLCADAPAGFCDRSGLTVAEEASAGVWTLTRRETRMLLALLGAEARNASLDVITRPTMRVREGQTGLVRVGQQVPVVTGMAGEVKDGVTVYTPKVVVADRGATLRVTPEIRASGQIQLRVEIEHTGLTSAPVPIPLKQGARDTADANPDFIQLSRQTDTRHLQATIGLRDGETVVVRSEAPTAKGATPTRESLWVLTPHIVRNDQKAAPKAGPVQKALPVTPPAAKPVPAAPPFSFPNTIDYQVPELPNDKTDPAPFVDHGSTGSNAEIKDYRVSAGSGFRIAVPALGPVPLALDVPGPVVKDPQGQK